MDETRLERLVELIGEFNNAMLVTRSNDGELRSRPMAIADATDTARLWFITSNKSGKLEELTDYPQVNIAMQGDRHYLSISGTARVSKNRERIKELWNPINNIWFEGPDDPTTILLEIVPTTAEYWDNSGAEGLKFLFESAKALLSGDDPDYDESQHGKVEFPDRQIQTG
ncbi:MAG: pyridoxamine 5'-phosphate oxidase family protein [Gammaproteobacteria bacterium]|nr:pyridoxamine 5'-phosphate oxidase family protein [Gammaproteobacteria bacterium]